MSVFVAVNPVATAPMARAELRTAPSHEHEGYAGADDDDADDYAAWEPVPLGRGPHVERCGAGTEAGFELVVGERRGRAVADRDLDGVELDGSVVPHDVGRLCRGVIADGAVVELDGERRVVLGGRQAITRPSTMTPVATVLGLRR
jgi:hypothetical protein